MASSNDQIIQNFDKETCKELSVDISKTDNNIIIVSLKGYIDTYNTTFLLSKMNMVFNKGYYNIIMNLAGINYVSSTGIGAFTSFLKEVNKQGGGICLMNLQSKVYEVFQLLGFTSFFTIVDSIDLATEKLLDKKIHKESSFPAVTECPVCNKMLKMMKAGKFRCSECKTILRIDDNAKMFLV